MAATACSSQSQSADEIASGSEMRFLANTDTRAAVVNSSTIKDTPFEVYGEYISTSDPASSHTQLFDATPVTFTDGAWTYGTPEYWMPGNTYSFIAMHPAVAVEGLTNKEYTLDSQQLSFTYTLPSDYTKTTDLLTAVHRRQYTLGATPTTPVSFNFAHALARLNFIVNVAAIGQNNTTSSVLITNLTLKNISNSATYTISPAPLGSNHENYDFVAEWSNHSEATAPLFDYKPNAGNGVNNAVLAIPQLLTSNLEITITYIRTVNGTPQDPETVTGNLYSVALTNHGGRWSVGQSYTYSFTLGGEEHIVFNTPVVTPWHEDEGANYIISDY